MYIVSALAEETVSIVFYHSYCDINGTVIVKLLPLLIKYSHIKNDTPQPIKITMKVQATLFHYPFE